MTDSRVGAGKIQEGLENFVVPEVRSTQKNKKIGHLKETQEPV